MALPNNRPLIGITCYFGTGPDWISQAPHRPLDLIYRDYPRGIEAAGGAPVLIPTPADHDTAASVLERFDGLLLSGGLDVSPRLYGEAPRPGLGEINYERDLFELDLIRRAVDLGLPILGICRGLQILNVFFGGTLYQDLLSQVEHPLAHQQKAPKHVNTHQVALARESRLFELAGAASFWVNSGHHQAIKELAPGLLAAARSSDGVVEAVEKPDHPFLLAVQWHPEATFSQDPTSQKVFHAFIAAARAQGRAA
ncbi:MAG: gamma-glutamyl-gamma-aminobutyrate hydrolase family protein [Thermodesulfobacteriota bacterium]